MILDTLFFNFVYHFVCFLTEIVKMPKNVDKTEGLKSKDYLDNVVKPFKSAIFYIFCFPQRRFNVCQIAQKKSSKKVEKRLDICKNK